MAAAGGGGVGAATAGAPVVLVKASGAGGRMVGGGSGPRGGMGLLGTRVAGVALSAGGGGALDWASRWPQVTQNRKLLGFRLPQRGHAGDG
jgi:hypothetical protein